MQDNIGEKYILNSRVEDSRNTIELSSGTNKLIYEVVRIIEGVPLFFQDHYIRLQNSMDMMGLSLSYSEKDLCAQVEKLVDINGKKNCNVKITVCQRDNSQKYLLYISKSYYPSMEEVTSGVKTGLFYWERNNPNAKVIDHSYKDKVSKAMKDKDYFEMLLVNGGNKITEGSRSNLFFVKGKKIFTAPDEYVLKGITRRYVLSSCTKLGFEVIETLIDVEHLEEIEGLFISGTSIKVLPIMSVDHKKYQSGTHPTIVAIRDMFDMMIKEYTSK